MKQAEEDPRNITESPNERQSKFNQVFGIRQARFTQTHTRTRKELWHKKEQDTTLKDVFKLLIRNYPPPTSTTETSLAMNMLMIVVMTESPDDLDVVLGYRVKEVQSSSFNVIDKHVTCNQLFGYVDPTSATYHNKN
ncbi:hypothetical protein EVAR_19629_1 [Eumeta japonica]|uniref:Uncharacterized protein n=1 Tax=Eumeta variegata TaxID=151549 RepID=A0A4C1UGA3_EUMVA|nr:hypothetical protein EVAR_19629_1 [Eumeta japonica]